MKYIDLKTGKEFLFVSKDIFLVTIRRSNGKPKPIYTGLVASKAFDLYHNLKIFRNDMKYLTVKRLGVDQEIPIFKDSGKEPKVKSFLSYRIKPNYHTRIIQNLTNIPVTCFEAFKASAETHKTESGSFMTVNKLIPILMSHFSSLTHDEQLELLSSALKVMAKHKILSGGDNTREIKETLLTNQEDLEDEEIDLL